MELFRTFTDLPLASSALDFKAHALSNRRRDFLAKAADGSPVFLLHDPHSSDYVPTKILRNLRIQFNNICRVAVENNSFEEQFVLVSCDAMVPELYEIFICCFAAVIEQLPTVATSANLHDCIQQLLDLFLLLSRPSNRELAGLWAELFVISICKDIAQALHVWHIDQFECFDFSWPNGRLEIKASCREQRVHEFALEQLQISAGQEGFITSLLLQPLSGGVSVIELAKRIEAAIPEEPELRLKLWQNISAALGSDFSERLDRRFDLPYAEKHMIVYKMSDIPAPERPHDPRITGVRFKSDISTVPSSLKQSPKEELWTLFRGAHR